jgi:hypothetical protein
MRDEIENILDNFDFDKVKKTMDALFWLWYNTVGVPEIADLRKHARALLTDAGEQVMRNKELTAEVDRASGGFRAQAHRYPDEDKIYFRLSFEVATWDNYNYE